MASRVRLHLDQPLGRGQSVRLGPETAHYLFSVMRLGAGAELAVFNGRDGGEWLAEVAEAGRKGGVLLIRQETRPAMARPDLWLLFAPVRKAATELIVEKATELGAARLVPVLTDYTQSERLRADRMDLIAREASEQSGATSVPLIAAPEKLAALLAGWDETRELWYADEALAEASERASGAAAPAFAPGPKGALLIGPEGGLSAAERARLAALPFARPLTLGRRILRAETAAIAALSLWLAARGFP